MTGRKSLVLRKGTIKKEKWIECVEARFLELEELLGHNSVILSNSTRSMYSHLLNLVGWSTHHDVIRLRKERVAEERNGRFNEDKYGRFSQ